MPKKKRIGLFFGYFDWSAEPKKGDDEEQVCKIFLRSYLLIWVQIPATPNLFFRFRKKKEYVYEKKEKRKLFFLFRKKKEYVYEKKEKFYQKKIVEDTLNITKNDNYEIWNNWLRAFGKCNP